MDSIYVQRTQKGVSIDLEPPIEEKHVSALLELI